MKVAIAIIQVKFLLTLQHYSSYAAIVNSSGERKLRDETEWKVLKCVQFMVKLAEGEMYKPSEPESRKALDTVGKERSGQGKRMNKEIHIDT